MDTIRSVRIQLLNGDNSFLGEQYMFNQKRCIAYLVNRGHSSKQEAEDIFSESILSLRDNIIEGKFKENNSVSAYLLGICINKQKDKLKHRSIEKSKIAMVQNLLYENGYESIPSINEDKMMRISSIALRSLTEKCEQVLRFFYLDHLSMNDIAALMGFADHRVAKATKSRCYRLWIAHANELKEKFKYD